MSGKDTTTASTQENLSDEQKEILKLTMPGIRKFAASSPSYYPNSTVADFNYNQQRGQGMALDAAGAQQTTADNSQRAFGYLTDPKNLSADNPYTQAAIRAAVRPLNEQYSEQVLPGVRSGAVGSGNFGSSRQGVAEGIASKGLANATSDTGAKIVSDFYGKGLDAMARGLGYGSEVGNLQTLPARTVSGVGDVQYGMTQAKLDEQVDRHNFDQNKDLAVAKELMNLLGASRGGSTTTTTSSSKNKLGNAVSSGIGGFSLGSALLGSTAGGGIGAGLMTLLSLL